MTDANFRPKFVTRFRRRVWRWMGWHWMSAELTWRRLTTAELQAAYVARSGMRWERMHGRVDMGFTARNQNPTGYPSHHRSGHLFRRMLPWWNAAHRDRIAGIKPFRRVLDN